MKSKRKGAMLLALVLAGLCIFGCFGAGAASISRNPTSVKDRRLASYGPVPVAAGGETISARLVNSTTYVALREFYDAVYPGCEIRFDAKSRTATVKGAGLSLSLQDGTHVLYVNDRCLYTDTSFIILEDGRMYAPIRLLAKTLGLAVVWEEESRSVTVSGVPEPILEGGRFYNKNDLYWLSRIISAESRGEPFLGQVAVGNVVLNRVKSPSYPATIYGVIFDRKHGVQFSPAANGTVYQTPYAISVTAAKVCLEGYTVSDRVLFFYEPTIAQNNWIGQNRPFAFKLGHHAFYY